MSVCAFRQRVSHLEVSLLKWSKVTQKQKEDHLAKVVCSKALVDAATVDTAVDGVVDVSSIAAVSS